MTGQELVATFSELQTPSPEADTLIFLEDCTEVQKQAQQLKLASLGRLSASIAHEIRNPLGAISHAAQLLGESKTLGKGEVRLCETIQNHSVRMNDVIENVLQLSRRKSAEPKIIVLVQWLSGFVAEFETNWQEKSEITVVLKPKDIVIKADPLHLSQVLANLCQNGLRYSKKKTGESKLLIRGGKDPQTLLSFLEIIDYGHGVEEELVSNLFEPFYTTETTGTGLGLYVSKELCAANDARLNYRRSDTGGSSFKITFIEP
jgi:two-component system sensor histidine kinase PilS (NtrC family)